MAQESSLAQPIKLPGGPEMLRAQGRRAGGIMRGQSRKAVSTMRDQRRMPRALTACAAVFLGCWTLPARGQTEQGVWPSPQSAPLTADALVRMTPEQLDWLYGNATLAPVPCGKVRGRAVVWPGTRMAGAASKAARVAWQGKVFEPGGTMAVNRFFGVKMIRGRLYTAESWRDGRPALILDYQDTSLVYARNRDEIRQVGPGLYLGLMYARTEPCPKLKMYFVLETECCPR